MAVPVQRQLTQLTGMTTRDLTGHFGRPALQVQEGTSLKLQFRGRYCVLDAYLYPGQNGGLRVTHVDTRNTVRRRRGSGDLHLCTRVSELSQRPCCGFGDHRIGVARGVSRLTATSADHRLLPAAIRQLRIMRLRRSA